MQVNRGFLFVGMVLFAAFVAFLFHPGSERNQIGSEGNRKFPSTQLQVPPDANSSNSLTAQKSKNHPQAVRKFENLDSLLDWLASSNALSHEKSYAIYLHGQDLAKLGNSAIMELLTALPDTEYAVSGARLLLHWLPSTMSKPSLLDLAHSLRNSGKIDDAYALVNSTASSFLPKTGPSPLDALQSWDAVVADKQFGELGAFALAQGLLLRGEGAQVIDYFEHGKFPGVLLSSTFGARAIISADWKRSINLAIAHPETEFGKAIFREAAGTQFESVRPNISQYFYSLIEQNSGDSDSVLKFFHYWAGSDLNQMLTSLRSQSKEVVRVIFPTIKPIVASHNAEALVDWERFLQSE